MRAQKEKNKQLIIETHSEYFIRKLQYLVAKNEIDSDNILINYFNPASYREKEGIVREISIEKDGSLSNDFGPGFFDEALNWKFELMKLKNQN
jgi:predicted ATPase